MFKPTEDRIACRIIDESDRNGIKVVLHDQREQLVKAKVIAVGPECRDVQVGHNILVPMWALHEIEVEAAPINITREAEVLVIIP